MSYVMRHIDGKLKKLIAAVPQGFLIDTPWLASRQIDRKLAHYYVKNGWLDAVVQGLYRRPFAATENPEIISDWKTTVLSMQTLMGYDVHIGGETALRVAGLTHYVQMSGAEFVYLYGDSPSWAKRLPADYKLVLRGRSLFTKNIDTGFGLQDTFSDQNTHRNINTERTPPWQWPLIKSSPERAILEMLNEVPKHANFYNIDMIFEGLPNIRPSLMEDLLGQCRSIKVKRLFFVFADRHNHAWRKYVSPDKFNLGKGPRALSPGGKIHPKYHISVPKEFIASTANEVL